MNKLSRFLILVSSLAFAATYANASSTGATTAEKRDRGVLLLTFDDGLFDSWDKALPLFGAPHREHRGENVTGCRPVLKSGKVDFKEDK